MAQTALISVFVVLDSGSSRSWCQQGCFLVRLPSSTCKWCLLSAFAWPFLCARTRWGRALVCLPLSLQRHQFYWNWAPPLWFHLIEINPEYSLEGPMMKLKLQYFDHLMQRADSLEKTLMLGMIEGRRKRGQRTKWLDGISDWMDMSLSKLQEMGKERAAWRAAVHGVTRNHTQLWDWKTTTHLFFYWIRVCFSH